MSSGCNYSDGKEWPCALDDKKVGMVLKVRPRLLAF
jgi:hypothetical protein